ncbi:MAG: NADP-dependent oxidoreductase [Pseudomonadota bacterium]
MQIPSEMRQWVLASRPNGLATEQDFRLETVPVPRPGPGEVLVRTQYLGVAPVMLRYMTNSTDFEKDLEIGDVMHGRGVGLVVQSNNPRWQPGDLVYARLRWREYAQFDDDPYYIPMRMAHPDLKWSYGVGTLGNNGFTALVGIRDIGRLAPGDRVLVSGAAGGVGSNCAFVAKALGASKVVGIAGGSAKCELLTNRLSYDAAIDYKTDGVEAAVDEHFPDGVDVFFDNVGGELLDQVMARIRRRARIVICGRISEYLKDPADYHRHRNLYRIGLMDAKLEGFFVDDYRAQYPELEGVLADWIRAGQLEPYEDVMEGLEQMPAALIGLYDGTNSGVRVVRIDPTADQRS